MIHKIILEVKTEHTLSTEELITLFEEMFEKINEINGETIMVQTIEMYHEGEDK